MLSPQNYLIYFILVAVLLPACSIPLFYLLPKKFNPGWIVSALGLLQIVLEFYIFIAVCQGTSFSKSWAWFMLPHNLSLQLGIHVDLLSALLLLMVTLLSWIITLYTIAYLPPYVNTKRYFSLYNLSLTAMLWMLVADNLWGILVGWELLSISSCLLIGFWYQTPDATQASTYAWVISKLGSICFLIGILLLIVELGSCDILTLAHLPSSATTHLSNNLILAGCCFIAAIFTKSAQFPFFSWLPQAMLAPTPVSALLHTATVLSAGIYLLVRIQPILNFELNALVVIIGHLTAFMGAAAALAQQHLKRMLAYSTLSHVGYVVAAIGLGTASIGISYLIVHAFAKACLFLIAGVIAQFLQNKGVAKQDAYTMSYMGGLFRQLPWVGLSYLVATGSLGIIPGLIGFKAKKSILTQTFLWASHVPEGYLYYLIPFVAVVGTGLTTLYMGQAFVSIFLGKPSWENCHLSSLPTPSSHQISLLMQGSMVVCATCILLVSYSLNNFLIPVTARPKGAWQSIVGYERIYNITQLISYGFLLLVIVWLVVSRLKSTTWITKTTLSPTLTQTRMLAPLKRLDRHAPSGLSLRGNEVTAEAAMTTKRLLGQLLSKFFHPLVQNFHQLFLHGWYLDACATFLAKQVLDCSTLMAQVEERFFGGLIKGFAVGYVAMAHMAHWLDHQLIGGIGHGLAVLSQQGSKLYLHLQNGRTQLYALWACIGMGLLFVIWVVLK